MIGLELNHPALDEPILLPFRPADTLTADQILSLIERVNQSRSELAFDQFLTIRAVIVQNPAGGGRQRRSDIANLDDWVASHCAHGGSLIKVGSAFLSVKYSRDIYYFQIVNKDKLCFLRAVVTAKAYFDEDPQRNTIRKGDNDRNTEQTRRMKALKSDAGIDHKGPCGMADYEKVQTCPMLAGYQLKIVDSLNLQDLIFQGTNS